MSKVDKNAVDVANTFQHYLAFGGDVAKTAFALNMDEDTVAQLAKEEGWQQKLAALSGLGPNAKEANQLINRAVNFVQGHRLRGLIDRVTTRLLDTPTEQLIEMMSASGRHGEAFSARPLTDLVKSAETAQNMTARALGDTAAERAPEEAKGMSSIAMSVLAAMNAADACGLDSVALMREEFEGGDEDTPPAETTGA